MQLLAAQTTRRTVSQCPTPKQLDSAVLARKISRASDSSLLTRLTHQCPCLRVSAVLGRRMRQLQWLALLDVVDLLVVCGPARTP